jgi:hypothetical protein
MFVDRFTEPMTLLRQRVESLITDLDTPGEPLPEGPEEPTTDPVPEDDPTVIHEPVEED